MKSNMHKYKNYVVHLCMYLTTFVQTAVITFQVVSFAKPITV